MGKNKKMMNRLIELIIKKNRVVVIIILAVTIPFAYYYTQQQFVNHIDIYFAEDNPHLKAYKEFREIYGNEELVVIAFEDKDIFSNEKIDIVREITNTVSAMDGIQDVFSITEAEEARGEEGSVSFRKIISEPPLSNEDLASIKKRTMEHELVVHNLLSKNGLMTAIMVTIEATDNNTEKRDLIFRIKKTALEKADCKVNLRFSGSSFVEVELNALSLKDTLTFTPIALLIVFITILLMLRRVSISILCMVNLIIIAIWGIGFLIFCGETVNMVTTIISPVLLAISVADSIHLLAHYRAIYAENGNDHIGAIRQTTREIWLPCLLTSLTTGIGFFSFIISSIRPVKVVGIFTCIGVMFAFIVTVTFLPAVLAFFKSPGGDPAKDRKVPEQNASQETEDLPSRLLHKTALFATKRYKTISFFAVCLFALTALGISQIKFETNFANHLPEKSTLKKDIDFINDNLGGTIPLVLLIKAKSQEFDFTHPESLKMLDRVQHHLMKEVKQFTSSFSIGDYYKQVHRAFKDGDNAYYTIPGSKADLAEYFEFIDMDVADRLLSPDKMEARISFQSRWGSHETAKEIRRNINSYLGKELNGNYTKNLTGLSSLYVIMGNNLKESQINSFLLAFVIIFFMMYSTCRNIKLTFISMIPNLFPIFLTLGLMGWLGIPLDVTTIMIASTVLGIAVDDTIHYTVWFRRNITAGMDTENSLVQAFKDVGKPVVITSLVLFLGFFILILGSIKPTKTFGVLTGFSMIFALIGDLFIYPALIMLFKPRVKK
ncbi:MAG: RND family transporter [bacterium]|nr:RND family transporter [bacterium]